MVTVQRCGEVGVGTVPLFRLEKNVSVIRRGCSSHASQLVVDGLQQCMCLVVFCSACQFRCYTLSAIPLLKY